MRRETSVFTKPGDGEKAAAPVNPMIGRTLRSFRIVSVIGEGGMGIVYLAEHIGLGKPFAIKSLSRALSGDPSFRQRFFEEARKQALLTDPNIVQVTDFFEEGGEYFLVMDYVDGQDLSHLIKSKGRLAEGETLRIFREILEALAFAHDKGLVHRDLKPSNVLVDARGHARLMDFGIAIMAGGAEKSLTATGTAIGSPWYMSPEQIVSPREVDQRTDIYALGIVLYEMLTGVVPFDAETDFAVKDQQIRTPPKDPRQKNPEVSDAVARIVLKAMAKDPAQRYQDCRELIAAVDAAKSGSGTPGITVPRSKVMIAALAAVLVAGTGVIAYLALGPFGGQPERRVDVPEPPRVEPERPVIAATKPEEPIVTKTPSYPERPPAAGKVVAIPGRPSDPNTTGEPPRKPERAGDAAWAKDVERKNAFSVIQAGTQKVWFTCTQMEQLSKKHDGVAAARAIYNTRLEERVQGQIKEHQASISSALSEYSEFLDQLDGADAAIVKEEFDKYGKSLLASKEPSAAHQRIQFARVMKAHYDRNRVRKTRVDEATMGADCAVALGKAP